MAQRSVIIDRAKRRAGSQFLSWEGAQSVDLITDFDEVLKEITRRYPLANTESSNNTTAGQNYITLPSDYGSKRYLAINNSALGWVEPDELLLYLRTNTIANGTPTYYSIVPEESKIYITPPSNEALLYYFGYSRLHTNSTNDAYSHLLGTEWDDAIIDLLASRCCGYVEGMDKRQIYLSALGGRKLLQLVTKVRPSQTGPHTTYWNSNWRMR